MKYWRFEAIKIKIEIFPSRILYKTPFLSFLIRPFFFTNKSHFPGLQIFHIKTDQILSNSSSEVCAPSPNSALHKYGEHTQEHKGWRWVMVHALAASCSAGAIVGTGSKKRIWPPVPSGVHLCNRRKQRGAHYLHRAGCAAATLLLHKTNHSYAAWRRTNPLHVLFIHGAAQQIIRFLYFSTVIAQRRMQIALLAGNIVGASRKWLPRLKHRFRLFSSLFFLFREMNKYEVGHNFRPGITYLWFGGFISTALFAPESDEMTTIFFRKCVCVIRGFISLFWSLQLFKFRETLNMKEIILRIFSFKAFSGVAFISINIYIFETFCSSHIKQ